MGCKKLTYQNFSFLEVIHPKKRVSAEKKRLKDYVGNYVYENGDLQFFNHAEGYTKPDGSGGFDYVYQYLDHLGNVRISYSDSDGNGSVSTSEIIEESNYYPFGLKHEGYNSNISSNGNSTAQKFKYNGIELEESLGLNLYEMDVRSYDPAIGRFTSIDPVIHYEFSTYNAFDNNPIVFADPSGANADWIPEVNEDGTVSYIAEEGDSAATLAEQFEFGDGSLSEDEELAIAEGLTNTTGDEQVETGSEITGKSVSVATGGNEVLKLDLSSDLATSQRRFDQFLFARDYSTTYGNETDWFTPQKYYSNTLAEYMRGNATMTVDGESFNVSYNIPMHRGGTFDGSGSKYGLSNRPTTKNAVDTPRFGKTDNLVFDAYHPNGNRINNMEFFLTLKRSNSGKAQKRLNKRFPSRNFIPLKQ